MKSPREEEVHTPDAVLGTSQEEQSALNINSELMHEKVTAIDSSEKGVILRGIDRDNCGKFESNKKKKRTSIGELRKNDHIFNFCRYVALGYGTLKDHEAETDLGEHLIKFHNFEKCGFREWLYELHGDQPYKFQICGVSHLADDHWQVDQAIRLTSLSASLLRTTPLYQNLVDNDLYIINSMGDTDIPSIFLAFFAVLKAKEAIFNERYEAGHPMELVWSREENNPFRLNAPPPHLNTCRDRFYRAVFQQNMEFNLFCGSNVDAYLPKDFYTKDFDLEKQKKVMQWTANFLKVRIIMLVVDYQNTKFCGCTSAADECSCDISKWKGIHTCEFCTEDNKMYPDAWLLEFDGTDVGVVSMEEPVIVVRQCVVGSSEDNERVRDHEYSWTGVSIACQCNHGATSRELLKGVTQIKRPWQESRPLNHQPWHDSDKVWRYNSMDEWYPYNL